MKKELPKQIKITQATRKSFWYSEDNQNCIGKTFDVTGTWNKNYLVVYDGIRGYYMVSFKDCETIA